MYQVCIFLINYEIEIYLKWFSFLRRSLMDVLGGIPDFYVDFEKVLNYFKLARSVAPNEKDKSDNEKDKSDNVKVTSIDIDEATGHEPSEECVW